MNKLYRLAYLIILLSLTFSAAEASPRQEVLQGPMTGEVLNVLDGDTVNVKIRVWIGQEIETSLRIEGIDAPEIKGKCEKERTLAEAARQEVERLLSDNLIRVYNVRLEKYAGRVMAEAQTTQGIDIGKHMIEKGLARPYHGEKRQPWCS
ncbi:MAG: thermonuclease family protein [Alphaproteobacteria bacterium]|nr:thermonuclease family protein [Alphaproteobacteria bacterium]